IYLGRQIKASSGGSGKYRGGCGWESLRLVWNAKDWTMFFMGNGYMNSDWGLMGGYPAATGYRFEAHHTGLKDRIARGESLPLGADTNPEAPDYEQHLAPGARVKRDQQCMTTEDCYENYDLYLNYLRGGPGFGDPLDRELDAIANDLNNELLLPKYALEVYGAVVARDGAGRWQVDAKASAGKRMDIRKRRLERAVPVRDWMRSERERILAKTASTQVQHMYATSFGLSKKFEQQFRDFWSLPADWTLTEEELDVPTYGSKFRMDLSKMPDVKTIVLVDE
ncbi:MAG: hydantoinase B/oxoprolinase family protein, partial [Achromobacter veterisilvae]